MKLLFDPDELSLELAHSRKTCTAKLGAIYLDAAETMARGAQFRGYPFVDDLVGDALVALLSAARSFDPSRCRDPNAFLATIIRRSFGKTIGREKNAWAKTLRLAVDNGGEVSPLQLDWLRDYEARKRAKSTRVDRA